MYKVIKNFTDLQDNSHRYLVGETYPRKGIIPPLSRYEELASSKNRRGEPLIEKIEDDIKAEPDKVVSRNRRRR